MRYATIYWFFLITSAIALTGCSATKGLEEGQLIYKETKVKIDERRYYKQIQNFKLDLSAISKTGTSFGILNSKIGIYNAYKNNDKGIKKWIKNKLGREPIWYKPVIIEQTEAKLDYFLNGKGFFAHQLSCVADEEDKIVSIDCDITLGPRYILDTIILSDDAIIKTLKIDEFMPLLLGSYFDRDRLMLSRSALTQMANNVGYADFREENIHYYVDTLVGDSKIDLYLDIIPSVDSSSQQRYVLKDIIIDPNYDAQSQVSTQDTSIMSIIDDNIFIKEKEKSLMHNLLRKLIVIKPSSYYSRVNEAKTKSRLLDLGLFRFVNTQNEKIIIEGKSHIRQRILLTPEPLQVLSGEFELNNRSGNFFGTGASLSYVHRNLFKSAEHLKVSLSGQVETQLGDQLSFINSTDLNLLAELRLPKIYIPGKSFFTSNRYIPRTVINSNFTYQRRFKFYTLESLVLKYGFRWRANKNATHELYPITINQLSVRNKSTDFQLLLDSNSRLEQSFENLLIAGLEYNYNHTTQTNNGDRRYSFFNAKLEAAGNILNLLINPSETTRELFGIPYAQYGLLSFDFRKYWPIGKSNLATRVVTGLGVAYGNSSALPYIKQFSIGGANSLRAFALRGLGPGAFLPEDMDDPFALQFVDRTGDIKIEWNMEYRFHLISYLKGAFFLDVGNVWLLNDAESQIGNFRFSDFYKQIAIGTGVGFRLDFDFFLIRLDIGLPLRGPLPNEEFGWTKNKFDPFRRSWRQDNLRYNIGIGYPF